MTGGNIMNRTALATLLANYQLQSELVTITDDALDERIEKLLSQSTLSLELAVTASQARADRVWADPYEAGMQDQGFLLDGQGDAFISKAYKGCIHCGARLVNNNIEHDSDCCGADEEPGWVINPALLRHRSDIVEDGDRSYFAFDNHEELGGSYTDGDMGDFSEKLRITCEVLDLSEEMLYKALHLGESIQNQNTWYRNVYLTAKRYHVEFTGNAEKDEKLVQKNELTNISFLASQIMGMDFGDWKIVLPNSGGMVIVASPIQYDDRKAASPEEQLHIMERNEKALMRAKEQLKGIYRLFSYLLGTLRTGDDPIEGIWPEEEEDQGDYQLLGYNKNISEAELGLNEEPRPFDRMEKDPEVGDAPVHLGFNQGIKQANNARIDHYIDFIKEEVLPAMFDKNKSLDSLNQVIDKIREDRHPTQMSFRQLTQTMGATYKEGPWMDQLMYRGIFNGRKTVAFQYKGTWLIPSIKAGKWQTEKVETSSNRDGISDWRSTLTAKQATDITMLVGATIRNNPRLWEQVNKDTKHSAAIRNKLGDELADMWNLAYELYRYVAPNGTRTKVAYIPYVDDEDGFKTVPSQITQKASFNTAKAICEKNHWAHQIQEVGPWNTKTIVVTPEHHNEFLKAMRRYEAKEKKNLIKALRALKQSMDEVTRQWKPAIPAILAESKAEKKKANRYETAPENVHNQYSPCDIGLI